MLILNKLHYIWEETSEVGVKLGWQAWIIYAFINSFIVPTIDATIPFFIISVVLLKSHIHFVKSVYRGTFLGQVSQWLQLCH